eukprot:1762032-Pleurochrysis_carterae.AAC.3
MPRSYHSIRTGWAGQMHLAAQMKAIHTSWILRYLHPRKAQWKQILDQWIGVYLDTLYFMPHQASSLIF